MSLRKQTMRSLLIGSLFTGICCACFGSTGADTGPATVYWEGSRLIEAKQEGADPSQEVKLALRRLRREANQALDRGPYSVTFKTETPPSGDKHDYMSFSRYWWPNPDTPDGLPYVRRDGEVNRTLRRRGDRDQVGMMTQDVALLSLAYFFFEEDKYADRSAELIRTWFLDDATRMNPHMKYGQAVPGRSIGRDVGILDVRSFIKVLDSLPLLESSDAWDEASNNKLKKWFREYLIWLLTSDLGREEAAGKNNHGSWFAAQTVRIALFVGEEDVAREIVRQVQQERIPMQFASEGSQPEELERTLSLHYSFFNLEALAIVARAAESLGIDLWTAESKGRSLRAGIDYLLPYVAGEEEWRFKQIKKYSLSRGAMHTLRMASVRYQDARYLEPVKEYPQRYPEHDFACLLFHALEDSGHRKVAVTVSSHARPKPVAYRLPDISSYSIARVAAQIPTEFSGTAAVGSTENEPYLAEAFRKERGKDFQKRQGTPHTQAIKVQGGAITLQEAARQLNDDDVLSIAGGVAVLRLPILVQPEASLVIDGKTVRELRLSTNAGAFLANAGHLYIIRSHVTSWDEQQSAPTLYREKYAFRPFISSYFGSHTYLAGSKFQHLGYHGTTAYGISLSSEPQRHEPDKSHGWPAGVLVKNEFHGMYYGFYSYEAREVQIIRNKYIDCILYGIDPHDRSTELVIAENTAKGTRQRHGIIGSRGISNSYIFRNRSFGNAGSGIMLDRQCTGNVVCENAVYANGQGIAIYESPSNIMSNNVIVQNEKSGIRVRNSMDVSLYGNEVVANGDYGIEVYSKRLDDHIKRAARGDHYRQAVSVTIDDSVIAGNRGGIVKGTNVSYLGMADIQREANLQKLEATTGIRDIALHPTGEDYFGSELKRHAGKLKRVFDNDNPLVEYRME